MADLTDKQKLFVKYYIPTLNATESARKAGYQGDYDTLRSIGSENLTKPNIRAAIDAELKSRHMSADEIINRLEQHATGSFKPFLVYPEDAQEGETTDDGIKLNLNQQSARDNVHLIKKLKQKKVTTIKDDGSAVEVIDTDVELYDAQAALVHLGKAAGLFDVEEKILKLIDLSKLTNEQLTRLAAGESIISILTG